MQVTGVAMISSFKKLLVGIAFAGLAVPALGQAAAEESLVENRFPRLAGYLNSAEALQAAVFDEIVVSSDSPDATIGKMLLRDEIAKLAEDPFSHYHTEGSHLAMLGPFRVFESRATAGIQSMIRREYTSVEVESVLEENGSIPPHAAAVLRRGQEFVRTLIDIYLDDGIVDKRPGVEAALADYLSNDELSVAALPKSTDLFSGHTYAYAFRVGFPQFSGFTWASQWLRLAVLEVAVISSDNSELESGINTVLSLYENKIAPAHGGMLASLPMDIPMMPVIAPNFYSRHPGAAHVVDNISMLKLVIGDVLAHPDVPDKEAAIDELLGRFVDKQNDLDTVLNYLTSVLRGGIFNQGGPALGGMETSERNRGHQGHVGSFPMGL